LKLLLCVWETNRPFKDFLCDDCRITDSYFWQDIGRTHMFSGQSLPEQASWSCYQISWSNRQTIAWCTYKIPCTARCHAFNSFAEYLVDRERKGIGDFNNGSIVVQNPAFGPPAELGLTAPPKTTEGSMSTNKTGSTGIRRKMWKEILAVCFWGIVRKKNRHFVFVNLGGEWAVDYWLGLKKVATLCGDPEANSLFN